MAKYDIITPMGYHWSTLGMQETTVNGLGWELQQNIRELQGCAHLLTSVAPLFPDQHMLASELSIASLMGYIISSFWFRDGLIWACRGKKWAGGAETNTAGQSGTQLQLCPLPQPSVLFSALWVHGLKLTIWRFLACRFLGQVGWYLPVPSSKQVVNKGLTMAKSSPGRKAICQAYGFIYIHINRKQRNCALLPMIELLWLT